MARIQADHVLESSTTVGTADMMLSGAYTGYNPFSVTMAEDDTCYYRITFNQLFWETGIGTYDASGNILERTSVIESSHSNTWVDFPAGTKTVALTQLPSRVAQRSGAFTATRIPYVDSNGELTDSTLLRFDSGTGALYMHTGSPTLGTSVRAAFVGSTASTTDAPTGFIKGMNSTGTPGANFGISDDYWLETTTTNDTLAARVTVSWATATHASRAGRYTIHASDSGGERECIRAQASGSAAMVSFYGATAVVQHSSTGETTGTSAGAGAAFRLDGTITGNVGSAAYTLGDVVKCLKNLGLLAS